MLAAFMVALALIERFGILPLQPWLMTACAVGMLRAAAWRLGQIRPKLKPLREGIDGEKAVGQKSTPVVLTPAAAQPRIVAEADRCLFIVRKVEAEVNANLKRARAGRQAVLARAFGSA